MKIGAYQSAVLIPGGAVSSTTRIGAVGSAWALNCGYAPDLARVTTYVLTDLATRRNSRPFTATGLESLRLFFETDKLGPWSPSKASLFAAIWPRDAFPSDPPVDPTVVAT